MSTTEALPELPKPKTNVKELVGIGDCDFFTANQMRDYARAALAAAAPSPADPWQWEPIGTEPPSEIVVIGLWGNKVRAAYRRRGGSVWRDIIGISDVCAPDRWAHPPGAHSAPTAQPAAELDPNSDDAAGLAAPDGYWRGHNYAIKMMSGVFEAMQARIDELEAAAPMPNGLTASETAETASVAGLQRGVGVRSTSRILPTYFVKHPDGSYTEADPQPEPIVMFTDPPAVEYVPPGPLQWEDGVNPAPNASAPLVPSPSVTVNMASVAKPEPWVDNAVGQNKPRATKSPSQEWLMQKFNECGIEPMAGGGEVPAEPSAAFITALRELGDKWMSEDGRDELDDLIQTLPTPPARDAGLSLTDEQIHAVRRAVNNHPGGGYIPIVPGRVFARAILAAAQEKRNGEPT